MTLIEELNKGSDKAIFLTLIGNDYRKKFDEIALPHYMQYCQRYDIGLLILNDYIDRDAKNRYPYSVDPGYQRLLIPNEIKNFNKNYSLVADMDADCIPGPNARNIFNFVDNNSQGKIYFTKPTPSEQTRLELGRRISLLRKIFHDESFPLDSLLAGDDDFEKSILGFDFDGPIATLGTCVGDINLMAECGRIAYNEIANNFSGYLQNYRNKIFRDLAQIKWLPYSFQAIWNYEVALYYPFLYADSDMDLAYECVQTTLLRVDMLHFAGNWPENLIFLSGPFNRKTRLDQYNQKIVNYLHENKILKNYGRLKFNKDILL
jgi:hypothetical protein